MSESGIDEGPKGFLGIFQSDDATSESRSDSFNEAPPRPDTVETPETPIPDTAAPEQPAAAERPVPERPDGGDSAADRVAANLALSLEEDGITLEEPEVAAPGEPGEIPLTADGRIDIARLSPEQIEAYVQQAIALQEQVDQQDVVAVEQEVAQTEAAAESTWQARVREAEAHYTAYLETRLDTLWEEAQGQDDPKAWYAAKRREETALVARAQRDHLTKTKTQLQTELHAYKRERLKPFYAEWLLTNTRDGSPREQPLPREALDQLLKVKDPDDMPERADELMQIATYLGTLDQQAILKQRVQARQQIVESAVRTPATGTPVARERRPYEGSPEEGASILSIMHKPTRRSGARRSA